MKDFVHNIFTNLEAILVEKFRIDVKVLLWFQSCWGISNRDKNDFANYGNAANQLFFNVLDAAPADFDDEGFKKRFFVALLQKATFFGSKSFFLFEKTKKNWKQNCFAGWSIRSYWRCYKDVSFKICFFHEIIAFWNRLISFEIFKIISKSKSKLLMLL